SPSDRARSRLVHAIKAIEDAPQIFLPNANTRVAHRNTNLPGVRARAFNPDRTPRSVELHLIVQQISQGLLQAEAMADHGAIFAVFQFQTETAERRFAPDRVYRGLYCFEDGNGLWRKRRLHIGIQFRNHEQVSGNVIQPHSMGENYLYKAATVSLI